MAAERWRVPLSEALNLLLVLLWTSSFLDTAASSIPWGKDGHFPFVRNASHSPMEAAYDYIVVGGGAAGCPLAATLSQGYRVLLLERGGAPFQKPEVTQDLNFGAVLGQLDDEHMSPAQEFQSLDGLFNRRARILGGGTAVSAGFYSRAETDWLNERNLNLTRATESYEWVESVMVSFPRDLGTWQTAVRDGLWEAGVYPDNGNTYEHVNGIKVGGSIFDETGHRRTAADLLHKANPDNIVVYLYAEAHQLEFEFTDGRFKLNIPYNAAFTGTGWNPLSVSATPKARGVLYNDEFGMAHKAVLTDVVGSEVIISAGALGSPQLLMLSGIGPADHLENFGIPIILDQPKVGSSMGDDPCVTMMIPTSVPTERSLISVVGILPSGFYIEAVSGESISFDQVQAMNTLEPEYRDHASLQNYSGMFPQFPKQALSGIAQSAVLLGKVAHPVSRGILRLNTTNIRDNPTVRFNVFSDLQDLYACVEGVSMMVQLLRTKTMANITFHQIHDVVLTWAGYVAPLAPDTLEPALLSQWCRSTVTTIWNSHGGALQGEVVDSSFKVQGVEGLRVIDASTFSASPGTNPQATVLMLGRYMGLQILEERTNQRPFGG